MLLDGRVFLLAGQVFLLVGRAECCSTAESVLAGRCYFLDVVHLVSVRDVSDYVGIEPMTAPLLLLVENH